MTPKKRYLKGTLEVTIHRGYDINDKTQILQTKCIDCGALLADISRNGKKRKNPRCRDSPDKAVVEACMNIQLQRVFKNDTTHTKELSQ